MTIPSDWWSRTGLPELHGPREAGREAAGGNEGLKSGLKQVGMLMETWALRATARLVPSCAWAEWERCGGLFGKKNQLLAVLGKWW